MHRKVLATRGYIQIKQTTVFDPLCSTIRLQEEMASFLDVEAILSHDTRPQHEQPGVRTVQQQVFIFKFIQGVATARHDDGVRSLEDDIRVRFKSSFLLYVFHRYQIH